MASPGRKVAGNAPESAVASNYRWKGSGMAKLRETGVFREFFNFFPYTSILFPSRYSNLYTFAKCEVYKLSYRKQCTFSFVKYISQLCNNNNNIFIERRNAYRLSSPFLLSGKRRSNENSSLPPSIDRIEFLNLPDHREKYSDIAKRL